MKDWYRVSVEQLAVELQTDFQKGLTAGERAERLKKHGHNELIEKGAKSPWRILWEQFTATMVLILITASIISAFLGKWTEASAILAIVLLFGFLGFIQEYRAEQAIAALKKLAIPNVRVVKEGQVVECSATELVPGDVILLEAGNLVPADLRLTECVNLRIQEAALTGESEPVEKETHLLDYENLPLGDRLNSAYMGTIVTYGRGKGVVTDTGMKTELGKIATLIQSAPAEMTPLQEKLDLLGKWLAGGGILVALLVMFIDWLQGEPLNEIFLTAVSVAVAVVPEGLPAVVTFTLALGSQRMLRRKALIRKLPAVETLGSVTTICSDKTGTLTQNRMTVTVVDVAGHRALLTGQTKLLPEKTAGQNWVQSDPITLVLASGAMCNDALLKHSDETNHWQMIGDPTEGALLVAAVQAGQTKEELEQLLPRVGEYPFDSDRKRMSTIHKVQGTLPAGLQLLSAAQPYLVITKGSVDGLLEVMSHLWVNDHVEKLSGEWEKRIRDAAEDLAKNGMRVLGVAYRWLEELPAKIGDNVEKDLIFVGMVGIIDPPRAEVKAAVQTCLTAGIRPVMITGDHPLTAQAIARELGIDTAGGALTGQELATMSEPELESRVEKVSVYARVSPEHKLRIVEALERKGHIVAMTGDGVNDAPALKRADIGVAMGITGTDVSKEASDMVLLDDNFATIVAAVEEGRVIFDNVRRFVKFSVAGNIGKIIVMLLAPLVGIPSALLPLQLLWLNLMTDGLLGLGLGLEPAERGTMKRPPRSPKAGIFSDGAGREVVGVGLLIGLVALGLGAWQHSQQQPEWQTMMFTVLAFLQVGQAFASRSSTDTLWQLGLRSNLFLTGLAVFVLGLQLLAIYVPVLQTFLGTQPLTLAELGLCAFLGSTVFILTELVKAFQNRNHA
jgi:Ca2+-transporting ATPase